MLDTVAYWCVAYTGPNAEEKADVALRAENYATFLPRERVRRQKPVRGRPGQFRTKWEDMPLYPRYIFIGVRPGQGLYAANAAKGVSTVLYCDEEPRVVPHRVIDALMSLADANGVMNHRDLVMRRKRFEKGQTVRVGQSHPLSGFNVEVTKDAGELVIALGQMFGQLTPIEFRPDQLTAI